MAIVMRALVMGALFGMLATPEQGIAGRLTSVEVTEAATLPAIRPNWPIPDEPNQLFYLQRSSNKNTIIYTTVFDANGNLRASAPGQAYWRRYNTTGERKALKPIEWRFAYGLNIKKRPEPGEYTVTLKPLPELPMILRQTGPGQAELLVRIGNKMVRPVYAFVTIDESGLIPKVTDISLHGIDPASGRAVSEFFTVTGGAINQ